MTEHHPHERRQDLEHLINEQEGLKFELEQDLMVAGNPKEKRRLRRQITEAIQSIAAYRKELDGLGDDSIAPSRSQDRPIWNVPHGRNRNFTGREDELATLRTALSNDRASVVPQAITGLGGLGKSQLVVEYAYRHASDYDVEWWVVADDPATLAGQYAALAAQLDLPERGEADQSITIEAVRRWFREHDRWLLVFDNAVQPEDLYPYLPQRGDGAVLITSRNPAWRGIASPLPLDVMDEDAAAALLLKRSGRTDVGPARLLAHELGRLPLALEQAGGYIEATGTSFATYLDSFRQSPAPLLAEGAPLGYEQTVATTWTLAFTRVEEESPAAAELLRFCAFLAPDAIPRDLLVSGVKFLPPAVAAAIRDDRLDEAVRLARRYSLLEVRDEGFSVHRLVQLVTRHALDDEARRDWAMRAVSLLYHAFPNPAEVHESWPVAERLLPHALVATHYAEESGGMEAVTGGLLNQMGIYLSTRARFAEAVDVFQRAVQLQETAHGPDDAIVARTLTNLGTSLIQLAEMGDARARLEQALRIKEAAYGPDHPEVASTLTDLAVVSAEQGDRNGARKQLERALLIKEAAYGPDHPEVATTLGNLGNVLRAQGDLDGARALQERALRMKVAAYGPGHPEVAKTLGNLGNVLRAEGDLDGARGAQERALQIKEALYGPDHTEVATTLVNLANVLRAQDDLDRAREQYKRALQIFQARLGDDHPHTAQVRNLLDALDASGEDPAD